MKTEAALTDIFSRKYCKGQSSSYWSLAFKSTKSTANLSRAEPAIPTNSIQKSAEGSSKLNPTVSALKSPEIRSHRINIV